METIVIIGEQPNVIEPVRIAARDAQVKAVLATSIADAAERTLPEPPSVVLVAVSATRGDPSGALARLRAAPSLSNAMLVLVGSIADLAGSDACADDSFQTPLRPLEICARLRVLTRLHSARAQLDKLRAEVAELKTNAPIIPVRDERSGAYDCRYLQMRLPEEVERTRRYGQPLSVVRVAIDDLRGIASNHGQELADETLRAMATALRQAVRKVDLVARLRGAEFVVVAPSTDEPGARVLIARLESVVTALFLHRPIGPARFRPAVRIGSATLHGRDGAASPAAEDLLEMATPAPPRANDAPRGRSARSAGSTA